jgi:hypothetical protein
MTSEIVGKVKRETGFDYKIDRSGNIVKSSYNLFKDPYTLVTLAILLLGGLYYIQMSQSTTNAANFDNYCSIYSKIRMDYILNNPDKEINVKNVLDYYYSNKEDFNVKFNITNG